MMTTPDSAPTFSRPRGPFAVLAFPKYRRIWTMSIFFALGNWGARLAIGWVVLTETESVFLTAATFAVRQAPQLIAAPIAGAIADRYPRGRVLMVTGILRFGVLIAIAWVASNGLDPLWSIYVLLMLSGIVGSFELPARQGLVTGSVPRKLRMNAVAVDSTGSRIVGALGALASGFAIDSLGVPVTIIGSAAMFLFGGVFALFAGRGVEPRIRNFGRSVAGDVVDGLKMMWRLPVVRTVLIAAVVVEIFGFAFGAVMPSIAKDALSVDVKGLGTLSLMLGVGSVIGTVFLTTLGNFQRKGLLMIIIALFYGLFIGTFSASGSFLSAHSYHRCRSFGCGIRRNAMDVASTQGARQHARQGDRWLVFRYRIRVGWPPWTGSSKRDIWSSMGTRRRRCCRVRYRSCGVDIRSRTTPSLISI